MFIKIKEIVFKRSQLLLQVINPFPKPTAKIYQQLLTLQNQPIANKKKQKYLVGSY